ncbi:uncharacterized protein METZ01_LOCUS24531 [marine metagenome]|uniref:CENP-V/GFA domain-containing protein n=1 Tax=marine metagenome TaxID=408172 RepID=A0A381Q0C8_9ZZZZ
MPIGTTGGICTKHVIVSDQVVVTQFFCRGCKLGYVGRIGPDFGLWEYDA